jgi:hypothetical protein
MVQLNFDARQHTPLDNDPVPEAWYNFIIDESNAVPTKDGNPNHLRLVLRFSIMDGPHQGRKVFTGLNIRHTNIQTMEIANRELSAICAAVGLPYVQDTQQLHNIPLKGRVKIRKDPTGQYDDQAEIKSYKPISFVVPGGFAQPGAAPQQAAPAAPTGWAPAQAPVSQAAPAYPQPQGANGGWQQPQTQQPWGQPQQQAPQPTAPVQQPTPQAPPPQQPAPVGFAAPTPPQQAATAPQAAPNPEATAAQQASPPWARG